MCKDPLLTSFDAAQVLPDNLYFDCGSDLQIHKARQTMALRTWVREHWENHDSP